MNHEPTETTAGALPQKPGLAARFYRHATSEARDGLHVLVLDGRPARTPGRRPIALASPAAAAAIADEWQAQETHIDPSTMPMTRIVNSALDGVAGDMGAVIDDLVRYAGSDLICYRAGEPQSLVRAQTEQWDPVLRWARDALRARLILAEGIVFQAQPDPALEAIRVAVSAFKDPVALAALHVMTTLSGSVLLALAVAHGELDQERAWALAHLDETHQESLWGADEDALARRAQRGRDFAAAARLLALIRVRD